MNLPSVARKIYVVLSPRSLPYARPGIQILLLNSLDLLDIVLITDSSEDRKQLQDSASRFENPAGHRLRVVAGDDLADMESALFHGRPNLRAFRHGHPCWRKITDPLLIGGPGEEMIILDPDLYFPNLFRFEPTPKQGLLLMWQRPNCLIPPAVVTTAMANGIRLARHVDIGVAHWRASPDLDWIEWMLGRLSSSVLPSVMHVEAIVWAAVAIREGGGYLDPQYWRCWERTPMKRVMSKLGIDGEYFLKFESCQGIKCLHAGGVAKWWLAELEQRGVSGNIKEHSQPGLIVPFVELTSKRYAREQAYKRVVHRLDVCGIFR